MSRVISRELSVHIGALDLCVNMEVRCEVFGMLRCVMCV